jgi:hypothetical protein
MTFIVSNKVSSSRHISLQSAEHIPCNRPPPGVAIIRMNTADLYRRFSATRLREALVDSHVVLIHGPRQTGKTTLAKLVGETSASFGKNLYAMPIRLLWEATQ